MGVGRGERRGLVRHRRRSIRGVHALFLLSKQHHLVLVLLLCYALLELLPCPSSELELLLVTHAEGRRCVCMRVQWPPPG